ncbi:fas apoptotic inhibitory molecule 3 isoform X2 [Rousettus aegyptiacus]|uniref:fas apoptotic inhibitory molecule 3 isoform X2 n=1 Tax=Rousettus aegyptiacus TaxID=9407 RepID=UPI00168CD522|nr:fas apoptotic inhibitory molecule 3 isoform X2 [Rousettus aegyptiacus]
MTSSWVSSGSLSPSPGARGWDLALKGAMNLWLWSLYFLPAYEPFWEKEPISEPPAWFRRFLQMQMTSWFQMTARASSFEFIPKVTTPAQRTEVLTTHRPSPTTAITHHPRVSRASSVLAAKATTPLPSTTVSKTSAPERLLRPQTASYNQHTRLHRQRGFNHGPGAQMEDQEFHVLIPIILGLILLALLGLLVKRVIQKRKALSRRARRLAVRMSALEGSQRPLSQRPRASQWPRSQNNVYSACPRRAGGAQAAGAREAPVPGPGGSAPPAPPQVSEAPWPHVSSLKTSCEYMSFYHQPTAKMENTDSDDYVNVSCPTHPFSCPPGPRPWCQ